MDRTRYGVEAIGTASTRRCELEPMMKLVQARAYVEA
jgi:hypothetical protein